jgi:hypothetical protein
MKTGVTVNQNGILLEYCMKDKNLFMKNTSCEHNHVGGTLSGRLYIDIILDGLHLLKDTNVHTHGTLYKVNKYL